MMNLVIHCSNADIVFKVALLVSGIMVEGQRKDET
jgi:hypothetical protein